MSRKILIFLIILFLAVLGSIFYFQWKNSQKESKIISGTRKVLLYYYNPEKDKDENGNIKCSRDGLVAIEREIPVSQTPIKDTIELLLKGKENLTQKELTQGITTEFPLDGFKLKSVNLKNDGTLILEFDDPLNKTVGGACRVGILWFQIEATARQFPQVKQVKFLPEELFQP
jgi:spore germination protein GerM